MSDDSREDIIRIYFVLLLIILHRSQWDRELRWFNIEALKARWEDRSLYSQVTKSVLPFWFFLLPFFSFWFLSVARLIRLYLTQLFFILTNLLFLLFYLLSRWATRIIIIIIIIMVHCFYSTTLIHKICLVKPRYAAFLLFFFLVQ